MLRTLALALCVAGVARGDGRWVEFRSDGISLFTNAGSRPGRETLVVLEQFRHALGKILGKADLRTAAPAQALLFKSAKEAEPYAASGAIQTGRERIWIVLAGESPLTPALFRDYARLLIEGSTDRMPAAIERGLVALFSTLDVARTRITLGRAVPPGERDLDWARVHLLAVDPEYYGKLPVLLNNLQRGVDEEPAWRNAFGKTRAEIDQQAARYLAQGSFETVPVSGRPLSPADIPEREVSPETEQKMLAELQREREVLAEYGKLIAEGSVASLERAAALLPKRPEPHFLLAQRETDPNRKIERLKTAVSLGRRNAAMWQALAEAYQAVNQFTEAARAWRSAEQAATSDADRARLRAARLDVERLRLDYEEAERKRIAEENGRELRKLKEQAIAELRALEARVNKDQARRDPNEKVVPWWEGPAPSGKARGTLRQIDCLGRQARLVIDSEDRKTVKLLVRDPSKIVVVGAQEQALGCGPQKGRRIVVEYFPKPDAQLGTAGDVATIEFP